MTNPSMQRTRSRGGHNIVELACCLLGFAIVSVLSVDIGIVCLASSTNDEACRDAARAAAQGTTYATALGLAQSSMLSHKANSPYMSDPTVDTSVFEYQDFGGSPPPNTSPYVEVTSYMTVRVPAPVNFAGLQFYPSNGNTQVRKTYQFPIVKTQLYLN